MKDEPLWTIQEVADYLRLKPRTISNKAQSGEIPARKVAGRWRFDPKVIRNLPNYEVDDLREEQAILDILNPLPAYD